MKYVVILGDGMADYPICELGNKTPLDVAVKPNIDFISQKGEIGLVKTVPDSLKPGSDTANLSAMGFNPISCYTGRSPLEAVSMGIHMDDTDIAVRCNLVTLSDDDNYTDKTMVDYSAGEIDTESARELIKYVNENLGSDNISIYGGFSYRHCLIMNDAAIGTSLTPPHDISGKKIGEYLPHGLYGDIFTKLIKDSYELLKDHPINKKRILEGKNPANSIWLWGEGIKPQIPDFYEQNGVKGAVISAVDLIKGIAIAANMTVYEVEGATGNIDTNFDGKADAAIKALKDGNDFVYIHMEAPDECGHHGDVKNKIRAIELIDSIVVSKIKSYLDSTGDRYRIMVLPDHPTPIATRTHARDPVPFAIYPSEKESGKTFCEINAKNSGLFIEEGYKLMQRFLQINKE